MSVTYNIGSLAAHLKLTAISMRHGKIVRTRLSWRLTNVNNKKVYESKTAQSLFEVTQGKYMLEAVYDKTPYHFGEVSLERNTETDLVVLLQAASTGKYDPEEEYFILPKEMTDESEYERRKKERLGQRKYGAANGPLHHFDAAAQYQGELGMTKQNLHSHPLLAHAQFDGVTPDSLRIDNPSTNEEGLAKTIELTLAKQLGNQPGFNPAPQPGR
jgi:hypothetical protein